MYKIMRNGIDEEGFIEYCNYINSLNKKIVTILEIGSYIGESSILFKKYFKDSFLFCVDPWVDNYDLNDPTIRIFSFSQVEKAFDEMMFKQNNYIKCKMFSDDFFNLMPDNFFDLIYIDGNHSYDFVYRDILNSLRVLKPDGILSGHDYGRNHEHTKGVTRAVEEILSKPDIVFKDSSWIKIGVK